MQSIIMRSTREAALRFAFELLCFSAPASQTHASPQAAIGLLAWPRLGVLVSIVAFLYEVVYCTALGSCSTRHMSRAVSRMPCSGVTMLMHYIREHFENHVVTDRNILLRACSNCRLGATESQTSLRALGVTDRCHCQLQCVSNSIAASGTVWLLEIRYD